MELSTRKLAAVVGATLMFTACASIAPPLPPSLELPDSPSDLRAARKGDKVTLIWTVPTLTTDRQTVRSPGPMRICRGLDPVLKQCGTPVGEVTSSPSASKGAAQKIQATYIDALPEQLQREHPLEFATYAVEVLNVRGRSAGLSRPARVPLAPTLPAPRNFSAQVTSQGVVLTWTGEGARPSNPRLRYIYRVYRSMENSQQKIVVGELPVVGEASATLTDSNIEWEQTYDYRASVTTVAEPEGTREVRVEGDDTPALKVFAHDVFPPAAPSGLQAVYSGAGQQPFIDLIWAPVSDMDLAGYNVYRHESGNSPVKVNAEPVRTPAYRDAQVRPGTTYFYSVSAVDVRGNESARSEEESERVP